VHFITDVFHPLISHQDGTFNLAPKFSPWRLVTDTPNSRFKPELNETILLVQTE
jgi:hypothetical protein